MNGNDIYKALNGVDEELLNDAAPEKGQRRSRTASIVAAACLVLALGFAMIFGMVMEKNKGNAKEIEAGLELQTPVPTQSLPEKTETQHTGQISEDAFAEWMRFFYHNGEQYMECEKLRYDAPMIGAKVGNAYFGASINKKPEDYAELCGSVTGPVFEVDGVDPAIMLCWREGDGSLYTMLNVDKTEFSTGRELYSDLLRLVDTDKLVFQSFDSWLSSSNEFFELKDPGNEKLTELIELMNEGVFASSFNEQRGKNTGSATELYFCRDNGLAIRVRAYPDGRLWLEGGVDTMSLLFVDAEKLDALIEYFKANCTKTDYPSVDGRMATADDLRADESLGRFMPSYIPDDYDTVYYWIYRRFDNATGAITGTDRIEFEIKKNNAYIHFEASKGTGGREDLPTFEEVENGLNSGDNMGRFEVRLQRGDTLIYFMAEKGCNPKTVCDMLCSIGE